MSVCELQAYTRELPDLLEGMTSEPIPAVQVNGVETDSRRVRAGNLFLACAGGHNHGLEFVDEAIARGATAIAWDADTAPELNLPNIKVAGLQAKLGMVAARFFQHPASELSLIGITGTDGKTSCAHVLAQAYAHLGQQCGYLGTLGYGLLPNLAAATHTTPDAVTLQTWLARLRDAKAQTVALEVSSHALDQGRVSGLTFDAAVLTNIGRDHLDYHESLEAYIAAKHRLFEGKCLKAAVLNVDDAYGALWLNELAPGVEAVAYGLDAPVIPEQARHVVAREVLAQPQGLVLNIDSSWGELRIESRLLGRFNAYNLLAALAVLLLRGVEPGAACAALGKVSTVPGRMELVDAVPGRPLVVVDYAHTPGALEQALHAVCEHAAGRVFCVFGCGGDRDAGKRPLMAAAAANQADAIWITDDNPRSEDPAKIVADILAGLPEGTPVTVEHDRAKAIAEAIDAAAAGDAVLIAGKGHETYQIIGHERREFDDREAARRVLEAA